MFKGGIKETLAQVFSREFCEIFKNTFFTEHLRMTPSVDKRLALFSGQDADRQKGFERSILLCEK